ncbi:MAG: hypothetical protein V3T48_03370 [Vicinamibacterales bacterium]
MVAPPLLPTGIFTYPGDTHIHDVVLLPGGSHALAVFRIGSVNLWSLLVYGWVEIVATVAVGILVVALWRLLHRRRAIGQPHCRRCNYLLVNLGADACPECGIALTSRNRVLGRPRRLPVAITVTLLVAVFGGYATGYRRLARQGGVSTWCQWLSPWLYDYAQRNRHSWLLDHRSWRCRVVEIDLADGHVTRTLFSRDGIWPGPLVLHPDGRSFFFSQGDCITHHDLANGRRLGVFRLEGTRSLRFQQLAVDEPGETLYTVTMDKVVWAWHLADGTTDRVLDVGDLTGGRDTQFRFLRLLPYQDRLIYQERLTGANAGPPESTVWDLTTRTREGSLGSRLPTSFQMSSDGRWLVCPRGSPTVFDVWDPHTRTLRETIRPAWRAPPGFSVSHVVGADSRFVVLARYNPNELYLWDLDTSAWAGAYAGPVNFWIRASLGTVGTDGSGGSDKSIMVAVATSFVRARRKDKIITWDISTLSRDRDPAEPLAP